MSNIVKELGLQEDDLEWYHLAACKNMDVNWFYTRYEADKEFAKGVDQICLTCPVAKICHSEGVKGKEWGVWGGVYMNLGRPDKDYNVHKTPEVWKALKKKHG